MITEKILLRVNVIDRQLVPWASLNLEPLEIIAFEVTPICKEAELLVVLVPAGWVYVRNGQALSAIPSLCLISAMEDRIKNDSHVLTEASH